MDTVREYRLLPAGLPAAQQKLTKRYLIPQLLILVAVMVISGVLGMRRANFGTVVVFSIFVGLFITYIAFISPRRMRRSLRKCWDTYILAIGPDYLLRRQADAPDLRLSFTEVKKVEHLPGRYLRVIGQNIKDWNSGEHRKFRRGFRYSFPDRSSDKPETGSQCQEHPVDGGRLCRLSYNVMGAFSEDRAASRTSSVRVAGLVVCVYAEKSQRFASRQTHFLALPSVCSRLHT
jgi:hypothetical protein